MPIIEFIGSNNRKEGSHELLHRYTMLKCRKGDIRPSGAVELRQPVRFLPEVFLNLNEQLCD